MRTSERDVELLLLVAEQYAITVEQLARLIGRSPRTGRWLRDRWQRAGWVEGRTLTAGGPSFLWLTRQGSRIARSPYRCWQPSGALAGHIEAVTEVRLLLERELRLGVWQSERMLAKSYGPRSRHREHLPDAILARDELRVAVEVELSLKSRARLEAIMGDLGDRYQRVWYFAPPRLADTLSALAAQMPWQNVHVHRYPPRPCELGLPA